MKKLIVPLLVLGFSIGCGLRDKPFDRDEAYDIIEAVFRYQYETNVANPNQNLSTFFLEVFHTDAPPEIIDRFDGMKPPVRKRSAFEKGKGIIFRIESIERTGADSAEVNGGYYQSGLSASGDVFTVVRKDGRWVVEDFKRLFIS